MLFPQRSSVLADNALDQLIKADSIQNIKESLHEMYTSYLLSEDSCDHSNRSKVVYHYNVLNDLLAKVKEKELTKSLTSN